MFSAGTSREARSARGPERSERSGVRSVGIVAALPEEVTALLGRLEPPADVRGGDEAADGLSLLRHGLLGAQRLAVGVTGDGRQRAEEGVRAFLRSVRVERLVIVGVAGGLTADLEIGDVVVAGTVFGPDGVRLTPSAGLSARVRRKAEAPEGVVVTVPGLAATPDAKGAVAEAIRRRASAAGVDPSPAVADMESYFLAAHAEATGIEWAVVRAVSDRLDDALPPFLVGCTDSGGSVDRGKVARHLLLHPGAIPGVMRLRDRVRRCSGVLADVVEHVVEGDGGMGVTGP